MLLYNSINTPLGVMNAIIVKGELCLLDFENSRYIKQNIHYIKKHFEKPAIALDLKKFDQSNKILLKNLQDQLQNYFAGNLKIFDIPLFIAGSNFQIKVINSLINIPYGKVITYKQQANLIDLPNGFRAVANANSRNMIAIVIPCHRVIGSNGALTGYSGGIERKQFLLELEKTYI